MPSSTSSSKTLDSDSPVKQAHTLLQQLHQTPKLNWISVLTEALTQATQQGRKLERHFMAIMLQEEASTKWSTPTERKVASRFLTIYSEHLETDD